MCCRRITPSAVRVFPSRLRSLRCQRGGAQAAKMAVTSLMGGICAEGQPAPSSLTGIPEALLCLYRAGV